MKAMILAAGFGSRLKEQTAHTPKCLVPLVDGTTILDRVMNQLKYAGVTEAIINLHYLPDQIRSYVSSKNDYGIKISFSFEENILGTGGGLKNVRWFFDEKEPFFLHNSDVWSDMNLTEMYGMHISSQAVATLAILDRPTRRPLYFDQSLKLSSELVDSQIKPYGFCGIQVISPSFFSELDSFAGEFSTIPAFMQAVSNGKTVQGYDATGSYWIDMGSPEQLSELNTYLTSSGKVKSQR